MVDVQKASTMTRRWSVGWIDAKLDRTSVGVALVLVSAVGFGTLGIFGVYAQQVGVSIPTVLAYRFAIASVLVWSLLAVRGEVTILRGRSLAVGLGLGGIGYATMSGLYFLGLEYMTAGLVAIVLYTYPAFVVVLAAVTIDERVGRVTVTALIVAMAGVALVVGADPAGAAVLGVVIVLGAAVAYATYITVSRAVLETIDPLVLTAHVMPAAGVSFLVLGASTGSLAVPPPVASWPVLFGVGVVATAVPVFTFFAGLERIGASRAGVVSTAEPLVTVALGALLFAEPVSAATVVGGTLILAAVVVLQRESTTGP